MYRYPEILAVNTYVYYVYNKLYSIKLKWHYSLKNQKWTLNNSSLIL